MWTATESGLWASAQGGGYTANAAINDRRIKAVGTVSAVNIGSMFRNGWDNNIKSADAIPVLENGSNARTAEARGAATVTVPLAPLRKEDAPNKELEEAWEYYHTPRCQYPTAPGFATARSLNQIITYDVRIPGQGGRDSGMNPVTDSDFKSVTLGHLSEP